MSANLFSLKKWVCATAFVLSFLHYNGIEDQKNCRQQKHQGDTQILGITSCAGRADGCLKRARRMGRFTTRIDSQPPKEVLQLGNTLGGL
jgi:hypothetical protein